ncbi:hypothetical protein ACH5AU_12870 [Streptomyces albidoflavus]
MSAAVDGLFAGDGGDSSAPRRLAWTAGDELVMEIQEHHPAHLHADWLDRRLAFAFALIGDTPPLPG